MGNPSTKHIGFALWAVMAMLLMPYSGLSTDVEPSVFHPDRQAQQIIESSTGFNASDGYTPTNITVNPTNGTPNLDRPDIAMQTVPAPGMMFKRTGACLEMNTMTDEAWLIGGRYDPNPSQQGDETETNFVSTFDIINETWSPNPDTIPQAQAYHECVQYQGKIYAIGDHHPFTTPEVRADGMVHIFDPQTNNWTTGTSMPATYGVGLAGMDLLGGYIYVAGGVSRKDRSDLSNSTLRYNPATDVWDSMANMSAPRHSFELVAFHGKLYAIGGIVRLFDAALNQTTTAPANHTEIYDPATNTWTNGSDLPFKIAAHASVVHNDEIVLAGGMSTSGKYDQIRGYNPLTGSVTTRGALHTSLYDFDLLNADGTLVYAGGDGSTWRFSTWSTAYSDVSGTYQTPSVQRGVLLSEIFDVRTGSEGSATPLWIDFVGTAPANTGLTMQYKTGASLSDLSSSPWRPLGPNQNPERLQVGNHTLTDVLPGEAKIQYQISMETTNLVDWVTPLLDSISVGSEEARFVTPPPSALNPNAALTALQTFHSSYAASTEYTLHIEPTTYDGFSIVGLDPAVLTYNPATLSMSILDPDGVIRSDDVAATHSTNVRGEIVDWSFAVNDGLATPYLRMTISTLGTVTTTYATSTITVIDNQLTVHVDQLTSEYSSEGDASVEEGEIYPGEAPMKAIIDHEFTTSSARLLNGLIEARINIDIEATAQLGGGSYSNPGVWTSLTTGAQTEIEFSLPNGTSGEARIWLEARTTDDLSLEVLMFNRTIVINNEGPVLTSTSPTIAAYSNEESARLVTFNFNDVGGFSNDTIQGFVWIEALDDGSGNGIPEASEYRPLPILFSHTGHEWTLTMVVNDTANNDHQTAHVWLMGTDLAGFDVANSSQDNGKIWWESRTSYQGELFAFASMDVEVGIKRLEPTKSFGWSLEVGDSNRLSDITTVSLMFGQDPTLGLRYNTNLGTCEALDARIQVLPTCSASSTNSLVIDFAGMIDWTFVTPGTNDGRIEVIIDDYDGSNSTVFENQWTYESEMNMALESMTDTEGFIQGAIIEGWNIASSDTIAVNATVHHALSEAPYSGPVSVYWNGQLQNQRWSGGTSAVAVNGSLSFDFEAPLGSGLLYDTELSVWDPYGIHELLRVNVPTLRVDGAAPRLLDSTLSEGTSRFHLSEIEIGVNIEEANLWSSNLSVSCQVRSLESVWNTRTLSKAPTTVFDGKTMFSFVFDFSELGDPSTLSTQANIACWADGKDDAGYSLTASTGNSELDPWLLLPLNNIGPDVGITDVKISGTTEPGGTMRLGVNLVSLGEAIEEPFNVSIYTEKNGVKTLVGREQVSNIGSNTATTLRSSITVPSGTWTLHVEADAEQTMWEVVENNNAWNTTFSPSQDGIGAGVMLAGGGISVALLGAAVVLLRRKNSEMEHQPQEKSQPITQAKPTVLKGPPQRSTVQKPKPAGLKGPPPKATAPQNEAITASSPVDGAAALDALLPTQADEQAIHEVGATVTEWSELPPGGAYDYRLDQTLYKGEAIGTWSMNEDKTFTKIE